MFRKGKPLTATKEAPFAEDKLGYGVQIVRLADNIMKDTDTPLVMTLAAPWGSGKSSFIKMWKAYLESRGHVCILFDAWRNDFHKEPLLALVGEIGETVAEICSPKSKKFEKIVGGIARPAAKILEVCAAAAPALALWGPTAAVGGVIANGTSGVVKAVKEYMQQGHGNLKKEIDAFKKSLSGLVTSDAANGKHIYFFVDELDRCRPEYALNLLEIIKHLFDVEGIVFVLAIDRQQLISMASTRYGAAFDGDGYFKRFVDVEYVMRKPEYYDFLKMQVETVFDFGHLSCEYVDMYCAVLSRFAGELDLTPRSIEKALLRANAVKKIKCEFKKQDLVDVWSHDNLGRKGSVCRLRKGCAMIELHENLDVYVCLVAMCREYSYESYMNLKSNVFSKSSIAHRWNDMERRIARSDVKEVFGAMLSVDNTDIVKNLDGVIGEHFDVDTLEYSMKWMNQSKIGKKSIFQAIVAHIELTRDVVLQEE